MGVLFDMTPKLDRAAAPSLRQSARRLRGYLGLLGSEIQTELLKERFDQFVDGFDPATAGGRVKARATAMVAQPIVDLAAAALPTARLAISFGIHRALVGVRWVHRMRTK